VSAPVEVGKRLGVSLRSRRSVVSLTGSSTAPTVFILTYCRRPELFYGTSLIFQTLRVGFPTARVIVVDNYSVAEVRPALRALAKQQGCTYLQREVECPHYRFLADTIAHTGDRPVIFVDPDVVFWESCEDWRFDGLMAGRLIPRFVDEFTGCITLPRLHPSFLWVPSTSRLQASLSELSERRFVDPFRPYTFRDGDQWFRLDTGANLWGALHERLQPFGNRELSAYDHLFWGSHLDRVAPTLAGPERELFLGAHRLAREGRIGALKGLWVEQEEYFRRHGVSESLQASPSQAIERGRA
jgi:hypothetical protein